MTKTTNIITINGKRYNAVTGAIVNTTTNSARRGRNVDGILSKGSKTAPQSKAAVKHVAPLVSAVKAPVMDIARAPASPLRGHAQQTTHTLMRRGVSKPTPSLKRQVRAHGPASALTNKVPSAVVARKPSAHHLDVLRLKRANRVAKSNLVSRFSDAPESVAPAAPVLRSRAKVAQAVLVPNKPSMDIFEMALAAATSHEQKTPEHVKHAMKKRRRTINIAATGLAVALLGGFIMHQNMANITLQVASNQAGFHAQLPGTRPSGFSVGKFTYESGSMGVKYHSNSDDRSFAITEKISGWDSKSLRDNFVATASNQKYSSTVSGGRTIYLYGDNNATWVNGGIWYTVESNGGLSERQLTDLASSM